MRALKIFRIYNCRTTFMKLIKLILVGIFINGFTVSGQNLINNSSFDEYFNYYDTNNNYVYHPSYWYYVDSLFNHPIYFSTDRFLNKTFAWNIHPDSALINKGEIANYISILILPSVQRAYTKLKEPLKKGEKYQLSIDIKAFDQSNYFSDLLVGFKDKIDDAMDSCLYQLRLVIPDSLCNENLYNNWITLSKEFIAGGKEKVLVISSGSVNDYKQIINSNKDKFLIMKYQGPPNLKYYIDNVILVESDSTENIYYTNKFDTLKTGEKVVLNNIYFDFDKYDLRPTSFRELNNLYKYLKKNKNAKILISGYTDNYGTDDYNEILSCNRAMAVLNYLRSKGISGDRLQAKGFGENYPIATNKTSAGRQKNRRIEVMILQQ